MFKPIKFEIDLSKSILKLLREPDISGTKMSETVLEVQNLSKSYKSFEAVKNISFSVFKGDVFGFLGPNGAGKSTTIRMITSMISPSAGEVKLFGKSLRTNRIEIMRKVGAIVESPDMYGYLSAFDNLRILAKMSEVNHSSSRIMEVLELVGLHERAKSKVKTFSHGMKQRLGIAQSLIHDPEMIILDEPANGLDPQGIVEIRTLIKRLSKEFGKTIVLSSHILSEVELIANRMVIINKGKVVVEGDVNTLLNQGDIKLTIEVINAEKAAGVIRQSEFSSQLKDVSGESLKLILPPESVPGLIQMLAQHQIEIMAVKPVRSLEEYFLNLT